MDPESKSLAASSGYLSRLVRGKLWLQVLIGMMLGLLVGIMIGPGVGLLEPETSLVVGNWLAFPGRLFLVTIQMIVVPLVFASIVRGLAAGGDTARLKQLGLWVTGFFVITTAIAATIGIQLALTIQPGSYLQLGDRADIAGEAPADMTSAAPPMLRELPEVVIDLLPENPLNALVQGEMLQIVLFAFIIGVDRLLDMSRTAVNVAGDLVASIFIDRRVLGPRGQEPETPGLQRKRPASAAPTRDGTQPRNSSLFTRCPSLGHRNVTLLRCRAPRRCD